MKVIDGIELLRMIKDGEIKEKQRFTDGLLKLEYFDKTIKVCRFSSDGTYDYYEDDYEVADLISHKFTIIEEEKDIEEINKSYLIFNFDEKSFEAMKEMVQDIYSKQCEIIRAFNKIKKEGK